jgi:hypothetical protein
LCDIFPRLKLVLRLMESTESDSNINSRESISESYDNDNSSSNSFASPIWNMFRSETQEIRPEFYRRDIEVGQQESYYRGQTVTDKMISRLVGLETYKALLFRWPKLYWQLNRDMKPMKPYLDLVDSVASTSNTDYEVFGTSIKSDLIRMSIDGGDRQSVAGALVATSLPVRHFETPFDQKIWLIIWVIVWIVVTLYVLWRIGLIEWVLYPKHSEFTTFTFFN